MKDLLRREDQSGHRWPPTCKRLAGSYVGKDTEASIRNPPQDEISHDFISVKSPEKKIKVDKWKL